MKIVDFFWLKIQSIQGSQISFIILLPLLFTIPLNSLIVDLPDKINFNTSLSKIYSKFTLADLLLLLLVLENFRQKKINLAFLYRHKASIVFLGVLLISLIFKAYEYNHDRRIETQIYFLSWLSTLLILLVCGNFQKYHCSARNYLIILITYFSLIFIVSYINSISLFHHLPLYENYLDILVNRFKGISDNTNNYSFGLFCSFALYLLASEKNSLTYWDVLIYLIIFISCMITLGRHGLLSLSLIPLIYFIKTDRTRLGLLCSCSLSVIILLSLRVNIIPISLTYPFINTDRSTYSLVHDAYIKMNWQTLAIFGLSDSEIFKNYQLYLNKENLAIAISQRPNFPGGILNFTTPHSVFLKLATQFGIIASFIFSYLCFFLLIIFHRMYGFTVKFHVAYLFVLSCLFISTSRIGWVLFFCLLASALKTDKPSSDTLRSTNF